jgi:hypothetical protein
MLNHIQVRKRNPAPWALEAGDLRRVQVGFGEQVLREHTVYRETAFLDTLPGRRQPWSHQPRARESFVKVIRGLQVAASGDRTRLCFWLRHSARAQSSRVFCWKEVV